MIRAQVTTAWQSDTQGNRSTLPGDYVLNRWHDVTGQPVENITPDPNAYVIELVADEVVIDAIDADVNYVVLWSEEFIEDG